MMHLITLHNVPIFEQLQIEEALLRTDSRNFCLINCGSPEAIVMGISGKEDQLLNLALIKEKPLPVIRRFSGGGTVYINEETLFVTFICTHPTLNTPHAILKWSFDLYAPSFNDPTFQLQENDYCYGLKKCGGNAQYIQKNRFLHHTSFLYDFDPNKMNYLLLPEKRPQYRQDRSHNDFLCRLKPHFPSKQHFFDRLKAHLKTQFDLQDFSLDELPSLLAKPHRKSTVYIDLV